MTDEQKAIRDYWYRQGKDDQHQMDVERIEAQAAEIERLKGTWEDDAQRYVDNTESLYDEIEHLREAVAATYIELSGKDEHASDCATSNAPAMMPGRCDCD